MTTPIKPQLTDADPVQMELRRHIWTAADLCRTSVFADSSESNKSIFSRFEEDPDLFHLPVVENGKVVGLINRDHFMRSMARRFHWEVYANKRCTKMMDAAPIVVDADISYDELANRLLGNLGPRGLSDGFVIQRGKKLLGAGLIGDVMAALLVSQQILAEELAKANKQLKELAITDALTGLHNRRHFDEVLANELARAHREGHAIGFIMADIDYFKRLNDKLGHHVGDETLQHVSSALAGCLRRPSDYCFRLGGEEFGILTVAASAESTLALAEILRSGIADLKLPNPDHPLGIVTISLGAALSSPTGDSPRELYTRTDQALYAAKAGGRNRVEYAGESGSA